MNSSDRQEVFYMSSKIKIAPYWRNIKEKGNAMVMIAVILPVLIATAGLALDYGRGVAVKTQLQKAADAAALAGAGELPDTYAAEEQAVFIATQNFADPDTAIYGTSGATQYVVELSEDVSTTFMKILGYETFDVVVSATAVISLPTGGLRGGSFPIAVINPNLNDDPSDDFTDWNYGRPYIIGYGEDNVMIEDWANGSDPCPPNPGGGNNSQGWRGFLGLRFDGTLGNAGANDLRNDMEFGWPGTMEIGDEIPMVFGNMANVTRTGREVLADNSGMLWEDFDPELHANNSRIVMVPIVHLINETRQDTYTVQDFNNGADWEHGDVVVDGFAPFFILAEGEYEQYLDVNGKQHDWMLGYFVPGVQTHNFLPPVDDDGASDFGLMSPPRLVD